MYRLFALVLVIYNCHAYAAGTVSTTVSQESTFQLSTQNSSKSTQGVSLQTPKLFEHLVLTTQVMSENLDTTNKVLTNQAGLAVPLSQADDGKRQIMSASAEYQFDTVITTLSTSQDIKPSAFSRKSYGILVQKSLYSGATQISAQLDTSKQNQPESYFINPSSLQSQKRLGIISNNTFTLSLEQIFTENIRSKFQYSESKFENFRPVQKSFRTATSYAVSSRWTFRNDLGYSSENRSESLYDDRGYFQAQWVENQINYEWQLDSFVGLGWSTVLENEEDPRRKYNAHLGTDTVGFFLDKKFKTFTVSAKVAQTQTSESQSGISASGELKWEL